MTNIPAGALVSGADRALLELPFELLDLLLYRIRIGLLGKAPTDPDNPPYTLSEIGKAFARCYTPGGRKIISIYNKHLLDDPLACTLWLYACAGELVYTVDARGGSNSNVIDRVTQRATFAPITWGRTSPRDPCTGAWSRWPRRPPNS